MYEKKSKNVYHSIETTGAGLESERVSSEVLIESGSIQKEQVAGEQQVSQDLNKWVVFALAASASFITTLDGSIVNIGLPSISQTFHVGISGSIEWVVIGYLVIIASVLLTFGRLADTKSLSTSRRPKRCSTHATVRCDSLHLYT